jgi:hypothetical protein
MPLYSEAVAVIRKNLEQLGAGCRVSLVEIGTLSAEQLAGINQHRARRSLAPVSEKVVFLGRHIYRSRIAKDGYTIDDVIDQIVSAMYPASVPFLGSTMTAIRNPHARDDRYGNKVRDMAVFECTTRFPYPELFSVIPKGDVIRPK